jgi:phage tail-like protein
LADGFLTVFNFEVHLSLSGFGGDEGLVRDSRGAFAEVSGLEINLEDSSIREGGYHQGARRLIGRTTHPPLIFRRGVTLDAGFWEWLQRCFDGTYPLPYVGGTIQVFPPSIERDAATPAAWTFVNGIATKVRMADLNASQASAVPIEELHLVHEGLRREVA